MCRLCRAPPPRAACAAMPIKFSVTQVMLPGMNLQQSCELMQQLGFDALELRVRYTDGDGDVTPDNVLDRAGEIKRVVAEHGLVLAGFASSVMADDLGTIRLLAAGAQACDCPAIRIGCRCGALLSDYASAARAAYA